MGSLLEGYFIIEANERSNLPEQKAKKLWTVIFNFKNEIFRKIMIWLANTSPKKNEQKGRINDRN